jgi:hypothetical protein
MAQGNQTTQPLAESNERARALMPMETKTSFEYTAKYDGKDYPVSGSDLYDPIALKRLNDHTVESTLKKVPAHRPVL